MYSIGEFSRATAITVKALRHYHELGLLMPARVDPESGYRHYDEPALERARIIRALRELDCPLELIAEILGECADDAGALVFLEEHRTQIARQLDHLRGVANSLDAVIQREKEAVEASAVSPDIIEKTVAPQLMASIRMKGRYADCAQGFRKLGRHFGFQMAGKAGMLIHDEEYREDDAEFSPCFPVRKGKVVEGIEVGEIPGGPCLSLVQRGPYTTIHHAYARLLTEMRRRGLHARVPSREVYLKGPGMIFKGNEKNYLTEVQIFIT
jgi:DNA-binding transcriptional MerR regulator